MLAVIRETRAKHHLIWPGLVHKIHNLLCLSDSPSRMSQRSYGEGRAIWASFLAPLMLTICCPQVHKSGMCICVFAYVANVYGVCKTNWYKISNFLERKWRCSYIDPRDSFSAQFTSASPQCEWLERAALNCCWVVWNRLHDPVSVVSWEPSVEAQCLTLNAPKANRKLDTFVWRTISVDFVCS